ncbi:uncharacterized protein ImpE3 [Epargyreus clarus]|uniref:uncharacterized protein ImpE3 n=1 Tax=Epargyreus clarus TaxID=520877 RepID=UPI003C2FB32F
MFRRVLLAAALLHVSNIALVETAKQSVQLSDSFLPVTMQVIAHLTDQMAFESKDETPPPKTTTTPKPLDQTTRYHKPGFYAPASPPKPSERITAKNNHRFVLLPMENNSEYTLIEPQEKRTEEPLLAAHNDEVQPIVDPTPNVQHLLPPHFDAQVDKISRSDSYNEEEINEENLQYLSPNVREMIRMANDPDDERLVDVWDGLRANPPEVSSKGKLSGSNLRLLLLYDLLSREAKRQRLSDYSGFSPDVMKTLVESSGGGARAQLSMALAKMVERKDCGHDYANNRAREMVVELAKDESKLSSELRYLQPLVYRY